METLNAQVPVELLLDRRVAIPVVLLRGRTIAGWNPAARELFHGAVGRPVEELFDPASHHKVNDALAAPPASCEVQVRRGGGELVVARVAVIPLGADARLVLISPTGAEYTAAMAQQLLAANDYLANLTRELSRRSAELEAARARFEALAELREHFVSMLAHDVRGALHNIVLNADVIEHVEDGASEAVHAAIARTRRSATWIEDLVGKVLEAAHAESGGRVLDAQPVSLRSVVRDALEIYRPSAEEQRLQLELVERAGDVIVSGDRIRLGQVLGNLLENAIRHSPPGVTVTVETTQTPERVRLSVRDRGPGIPVELRGRLFERFVQGANKTGSAGLGLYVARQLVELHGGRIIVEDVVPHGTAMIVELPRPDRPRDSS